MPTRAEQIAHDTLLADMCERVGGPVSQEQLAEYTGVSHQMVSKIENRVKARLLEAWLQHGTDSDILAALGAHGARKQ